MQKNTGLLIFNSLKQKKLIFNFVVNRHGKKLTDSRKKAKILADNRKRHHPIETLCYNKCKDARGFVKLFHCEGRRQYKSHQHVS